MPTTSKTIAPLDKVTLHVQAVPRDTTAGLKTVETDVTFICGIGPTGLMPFEQMLLE